MRTDACHLGGILPATLERGVLTGTWNRRGVDANADLAERDRIDVEPTKALFVEMLTRDLAIDRAILDLVDNCIDGAKRLRPAPDESLEGLSITVTLDAREFRIEDNCGGFGIEAAREYAFRFGRPKNVPFSPHSIGQFGIGMKRALFKFGRWFEVTSQTTNERFRVAVDVDEWEQDPGWYFQFAEVERDHRADEADTGTSIVIRNLRQSVSDEFALDTSRRRWSAAIESAQQQFIDRGLTIRFDGRTLVASPWQLRMGEGLTPSFFEEQIGRNGAAIDLRIYGGVADSDPRAAGWYVLCNGRMILEADQSPVTGWSQAAGARAVAVPKYHNQFARFRGYAFFDCEDPSKLPWNTTKTGVDQDSAIYRYAFEKLVETMRPVIDFLNELDGEKDNAPEDQPLTQAVQGSRLTPLRDLVRGPFRKPERRERIARPVIKVQYQRERSKVDELRDVLRAGSAKEVGEQSFDLAYERYVSDREDRNE